ncbi:MULTISPECIES: enediyne biosynthesis protein [unclassified Micromonospora]|uniref:enediyne biosynthesis protein n=1 Tax=unclassified Micromonospora TaxID=2617518 RepID=UPI0010431B3F|nr:MULTISPECIES: enediyne biosynthesis protein [unclassified Micromonospora]TDB81604.1 enediyne biosynthesis protein [Micromonospora sp. KC721]TDC42918.1 enediyne biosynthesis protein [Micromonospora sp. KC213]
MAETTISPPRHDLKVVKALRNFAISITVFNIVGYTVLGFEQPWLWPFVALATGYTLEIVLEVIGARMEGRRPRFLGNGVRGLVEFLYPAHITSLAMNMLTYVNDQVLVLIFGVSVAIGAKWVLRAPVKGRMRHYMNPSNFGIAVILLLFPWGSIAPPYHFTEHISGPLDWALPLLIILGGTMINGKLTGRMWLIFGWLLAFAIQAVVRGLILDTSIPGALAMMTGTAFILFTNYMVTDPGTTPSHPAAQFAFGAGVAVVYAFLTGAGIAYGIFFATALVCLARGGFHWALHFIDKARAERAAAPPPASEPAPATPVSAISVNGGPVHGDRKVVPA